MYMILAECSAAMRRSVEGVDYYVAEASEAFRALEDMVREMQIPAYEQKEIVERLMQAKHYLKTDFKVRDTSINIPPLKGGILFYTCVSVCPIFLFVCLSVTFFSATSYSTQLQLDACSKF